MLASRSVFRSVPAAALVAALAGTTPSLGAPPVPPPAKCAGDLNNDRVIDSADLFAALSRGHADLTQLNLVLSAFGQSCD